MRFSIILPAHNGADRIRTALDSVAKQSFKDYELIVICDACEDETAEIAREYGAIVLEVDNHNPGPTRNAGLDIATGEWVLFMDDDDWWLHEFVFEELDKHLGDEDLLCYGFVWKDVGLASPVRENGTYWPAPWTKAWRRTAIGGTRFPSEYPDDLLFTNKMLSTKLLRIKCWDMPLYYYNYMRPGSITDVMCRKGVEPDLRVRRDDGDV